MQKFPYSKRALPVLDRLQRISNSKRQNPVLFSVRMWQHRVQDRRHYQSLCKHILGNMSQRSVLLVFQEWYLLCCVRILNGRM